MVCAMRSKKLARNTISSLVFQLTTIICGFILPRLILLEFGSSVNGLVNSVSQFLHMIAFLELGVGSVVQSSLYKPLAEKDNVQISKTIVSAEKFFKRLAQILLVYIIALMIIYPCIAEQRFDYIFTATLIAAMSVSSFAQYYIGVVDRLLLNADQRGYIQYDTQTITLIMNTAAGACLIYLGASIHIVKLTTSLFYAARPLVLRWYVNRHYDLDRKIRYEGEPIKQKWNGVAQHIATVVLESTASVVLTTLATLADVSVYSVYHLIVAGVKQIFLSMMNGIHALFGELWAKQELEELRKALSWTEWVVHTGTVFVFGCSGVLILPFVQVYTQGIHDANYLQPLFGFLMVLSHSIHCLRLPYSIMILAGGHYKQTQHHHIIAAMLNLIVAIIAVKLWGLVGVALGTLVALTYQIVWMAIYNSKNLLRWPITSFMKQIMVDAITAMIAALVCSIVKLESTGYAAWVLMAVHVTGIWFAVIVCVNSICYRDKLITLMRSAMRKSSG